MIVLIASVVVLLVAAVVVLLVAAVVVLLVAAVAVIRRRGRHQLAAPDVWAYSAERAAQRRIQSRFDTDYQLGTCREVALRTLYPKDAA